MNRAGSRNAVLITAWIVVLALAMVKIVLQESLRFKVGEELHYTIWAVIVAAALALTFAWQAVRPLRPFLGMFAVLVAAQWFVYTKLDRLPGIHRWLNDPSFSVSLVAERLLSLIVTLAIIAVLFLIKRRREAFFLARGDTDAAVEPVKWLGVGAGERWKKLGRMFALYLSLGTLAFLVIAGRPPLDILVRVLPFLPAVVIAAALNALNEEMQYKASFLAVLEEPVGKHQALWLMAAFFGILHFYGVPYGVMGVLMAGFLGWLLGKSMLETRGLFWAWFLHFLQDVWIFAFMAIGSIRAGG